MTSDRSDRIRIGFLGAGGICRLRHIPNLQKIAGVEVAAVANRTLDSARKVCAEFHIPDALDNWRALLDRPDIDAVFIGTWPYMHMEMTLAALEAGKHVFCQARMAMDLPQAQAMHAAAAKHPHQVTMICPPPHRMPFEPAIRRLLAEGALGQLSLIELHSISGANLDPHHLTWREDVTFSGQQVLAVGIYAEVLHALVGEYAGLRAVTAIPLPEKRLADGRTVTVRVPQVVSIIGTLPDGTVVNEQHSGLATDVSTRRETLTIHGSAGTLRHHFLTDRLELAQSGQPLAPLNVPAGEKRAWWAEEEFITAVRSARRGQAWTVTPDFTQGLAYMRKMAAIHQSAATGQTIDPRMLV